MKSKQIGERMKMSRVDDTVFIEYLNEYEPFEKMDCWQKDSKNICTYYEGISDEKVVTGRHWHESLEVIYVIEGAMEITTSNGNIFLDSGEVAVIGGIALHGTKAITKKLHHQCLHIKYDFISKHLEWDDLQSKMFKIRNVSKFLSYYVTIIKNLQKKDYISQMKYIANILLLLTSILEDENFDAQNIGSNNLDDKFIKILFYINFNYKENITLNSVAEHFCYTPQNIAILFKKRSGKTFHTYLTEIRLENAVHLLLNSDKKILEIALELGFPNEMAFISKFKSKYNTTPNIYRKQKKVESISILEKLEH